MSNVDAESTPEEGRARRIRGWGPGGLCLINPSQPYHCWGPKKTNKHKQLRGIVPEMGGGQIVYVFPFFLGKRETHKQNSQEISGKGRDSPGTVRENPGTIP